MKAASPSAFSCAGLFLSWPCVTGDIVIWMSCVLVRMALRNGEPGFAVKRTSFQLGVAFAL